MDVGLVVHLGIGNQGAEDANREVALRGLGAWSQEQGDGPTDVQLCLSKTLSKVCFEGGIIGTWATSEELEWSHGAFSGSTV